MVCHSVDGVYHVEGETWPLNNCTQCLCHVGHVLCKTHHCTPTPCPEPVSQPGQCCAVCPESAAVPVSEYGESCGAHRPHGAAWIEDICHSCVCVCEWLCQLLHTAVSERYLQSTCACQKSVLPHVSR